MYEGDGIRPHQSLVFALFVFAMLLPAISIPSLFYAIKIIRKNGISVMNMLRCILNGAYVLVFGFDIIVLCSPTFIHTTK